MSGALEQVYTDHLAGMARRECDGMLHLDRSGEVPYVFGPDHRIARGPNLADALAALLRDLGVTVPDRVTEEQVREAARIADEAGWRYISDLHASGEDGALMAKSILVVGS
jgi:hypothetical protein